MENKQQNKTMDEVTKEMSRYGLETFYDIDLNQKPTFYVSTEKDESVGIFGIQMSPFFHRDEEMFEWWEMMKSLVED